MDGSDFFFNRKKTSIFYDLWASQQRSETLRMKKRREAETRLLEMCQEIDVDKDGALDPNGKRSKCGCSPRCFFFLRTNFLKG